MSIDTLILILEAVGVLGAATLIFIAGHHQGRRSCRNEYPDGFDCGQAAERQRWEDATGTRWDTWEAKRDASPEGQWPYGFSSDPAIPPATMLLADDAAERLAEADAALRKPPQMPSVAEVDELAARYQAAQAPQAAAAYTLEEIRDGRRMWGMHWGAPGEPGHPQDDPRMAAFLSQGLDEQLIGHRFDEYPPVVADITDAARWRPFDDDVPTITGVIVGPHKRDRTGPEWLDAQLAAMDSETDAYLRRLEAEMASFRRGIPGACS